MGTAKQRQANVLELLTKQHDLVDQLIGKLEKGNLDSAGKLATFQLLADNLAAHAAMEEKLFYPEVRAKLVDQGLTPRGTTPDELASATRAQLARYAKLMQEAHIKGD
jgi:hypothetical protein